MKVLFVGGTGFISTAVSRQAIARGMDLYLLNRGRRQVDIPGATILRADISNAEEARRVLDGHQFDVVVDWVAYHPLDVERDLALFKGRVKQFVFISSASAYQKPPTHYVITESTPLANPHWEYSRNKIACEERLLEEYRNHGFPVTIVRPSLTYDPQLPMALGGWGCYTFIDRLKRGRPIIVHGDGSSLWVVTHAEDFARGFLGLLGNYQAVGHAFHITTDEVLTWDQIYLDDRRGGRRRAEARAHCVGGDRPRVARASRRTDRRQDLERRVRQHEDQNLGAGLPVRDPVPRGHPPHDRPVRSRRKPPPRGRCGEPRP